MYIVHCTCTLLCTLYSHSRKKRQPIMYVGLSNRAHIWPNLELEGGKPIHSP